MHENLIIIDHPVLKYKLGQLRDKKTTAHSSRKILAELSSLMAYEITKDLNMSEVEIETPITKTKGHEITDPLLLVAILRAGLTMVDGILETLPFCKVGHIGIYRDKFFQNTVEYYFKIPSPCKGLRTLLCDPMLATGDTIVSALNRLKEYEVGRVDVLSLLCSAQALENLREFHPETKVYACSLENGITNDGLLTPGIGDIGDRLFGTL